MDVEEDEQEPAQELIASDPEGNNEDPPPATDAVPRQINQDFHEVVQEMAEPEAERGEMQPGDYKTERPAQNRRPPSTFNYEPINNGMPPNTTVLPSTFGNTSNPIPTNSVYSPPFHCIPITCSSNLF